MLARGYISITSYAIHAGQYKTRPNSVITRYGDRFEYALPEETQKLMSDLENWYNTAEKEAKLSPIELTALFHYRYIRIHPFEDGNGRIARLMMNFILKNMQNAERKMAVGASFSHNEGVGTRNNHKFAIA